IVALIDSDIEGPMNLGNPGEFTIKELADLVVELTGTKSTVTYESLPTDDPLQRKPDITFALKKLNWQPTIPLREGIVKTINYFQKSLGE
ncbi:MAG: UDP-glucuronate decarboxylase, partial [Patescibacteria group bacterium]|nr:UDP-glucuronate decarboxylase [Patescibacteria group bacterium]